MTGLSCFLNSVVDFHTKCPYSFDFHYGHVQLPEYGMVITLIIVSDKLGSPFSDFLNVLELFYLEKYHTKRQ